MSSRIKETTQFKLDYSNVNADENLNKYRQSKQIVMKNLSVANELSVGKIKIDNSHITTTNKKDPVIYFDNQVNILQSAYTDDVDVINTDKNTSFVDYRNLSRTYYAKIGSPEDENVFKNNKCVDSNNNLYVILQSYSTIVNVFDSTNNNVPVADIQAAETDVEGDPVNADNIVLVKYNHLGEHQWSTRISGFYDKYFPSLVCDNDGNIAVCFGNDDIDNQYDVSIYDTSSNSEPVEQITDLSTDSSIIVKYDTNGLFLWSVHVNGMYANDSIFSPRISCDVSGNIFLSHALRGTKLQIYDKTPSQYVQRPDDFFCVMINHFHSGHLIYTQPIYEYSTGLSSVNFVTMKFDKDGKFKWINHVEMGNTTDETMRCFVDNDIEGNVILSGNFQGLLKVYNPLNTTNIPDEKLTYDSRGDGNDNIFLIKFNTNGSVVWCTKAVSDDDDSSDVNTIIDSNCNIYLSFKSQDNTTYLYDTEDKISEKHEFVLKQGYESLVIVKYDKEGVIQWFTAIDGFDGKYEPCLAIDNRFIKGNENSNIYLSGSYYGNLNFYNSTDISHIAYTLAYDNYVDDYNESIFLSCFDQDGMFSWATKVVTAANDNSDDTYDATIVADKDGHVYLMGEYEGAINIYDAQNNDKPVATLTVDDYNGDDDDIFIIKYNRYGLLNTSNPKLLYIEDNSDLPDSFCKEVILTNNDNNGIVSLQIMKKENYGYSVRRHVLITEAIELITKGGIWIPKIISDQYEYVNDLDVIDTNTKTSFVNYENLQNSFYTKIGGEGYDLNPQICLDKNDNVYMSGVYESDELGVYDFTNNTIPIGSLQLDGEQSLFLTKYDKSGVNKWYTRIGGYYTKEEPSVFANGKGDMFVTMQSRDDGPINIYDVNNQQDPVKELIGFTGFTGYTGSYPNTIFCKYNTDGEFQWNVRMVSINLPTSPSFTSTAVVTGDLQGNLFVCGYFDGDSIVIVDTSNDENPAKIFTRDEVAPGAYFICKFDYTGKFLWINHLAGGLIPNNNFFGEGSADLLKFIRIGLNTDSFGNLYLTSSFYYVVLIYNPDSTEAVNIVFGGNSGIGIFSVKYNSSGIYQWHNGIFTETDDIEFSGALQSGNCVDADGNLYISFSNSYLYDYAIFDTRNEISQPVYVYSNEELHDSFVSIVKFNHNGIFQWNNRINGNENQNNADFVFNPVITCENQYITGQYNPNIYVHFNGIVDDYRSGFNFYNASSLNVVAYTLPSKDYWIEDTTTHSILSKFDSKGNFQWATTSAAYSYTGEGYDIFGVTASNVQVDSSGHVYICGSFFDNELLIWDVSTNGPNDDPVGAINNVGNVDCFLIKYNRYGLVNSNTHRDIYLEDVPNIPNAFEKSIVITNNINNGPVNCQILEPLSSGFGYNVRKNITLIDCLDLVSHDGQWIPKIQAEQISIKKEVDVIDPNTKLSVLDYSELDESSWVTSIYGEGDEKNIRLSSDKNNNVYALCSFSSNDLYLQELTSSGYDVINKNSQNRDIALVKYLPNGRIGWYTRIGFDSNFTGYPTIYTDADGNSYVSIVKTDDETENNIYIYDTRDINDPIKSTSLTNYGACLIKYDKNGVYLWDIRISARFNSSGGTYGTNAVADKNGNVYLTGFILNDDGVEIRDSSDYIQNIISTDNGDGMFVVKFDKTGKYVWSIPLYYGVNTEEDKIALSCDQDGGLIVSATQFNTVSVHERIENAVRFFKDIYKVTDSSSSLFTVKYDTNGKCLWTNRLGCDSTRSVFQPVSTIDSYGNYYLAAQITGDNAHFYDTRKDDVRFIVSIPGGGYKTVFCKYNKNGIIQWYNFVSGNLDSNCVCVDNKFTQGITDNSFYLSGTYAGDVGGIVHLYNSANDGDVPQETASLSTSSFNSYLIKFNTDGNLIWCSKVGGSDTYLNNSIVATNDGHVYLGGEFNTEFLNIYQGWTLGMNPNSDIAQTIENDGEVGTFDIFLVKYNRYGTVNNNNGRLGKEIYLENDSSIPDGTEKNIVVVNNNEYNGFRENVCLIVLEYNNPGYTSFRNIWFSEGVSLISYGGQWFIKSSSGDTLPKRSIIMWGGDQNNIPQGWRLCDGGDLNNVTTPDLRGRFILGFNNSATGSNGTSTNGGITNLGTGARVGTNLSGGVGNNGGEVLHTLTVDEMPTHNHGGTTGQGGYAVSATDVAVSLTTTYVADDSAGGHTHTISSEGGSDPHNNLPPFYVLCYIMKCF